MFDIGAFFEMDDEKNKLEQKNHQYCVRMDQEYKKQENVYRHKNDNTKSKRINNQVYPYHPRSHFHLRIIHLNIY